MMASLFLSRVLGILRDMIMAWSFGQGPETDAYVLAFQIPDLLFFLIAGGALSSAFIPVFSEYLHTNREDEAWHVFSVVATVMSILVTAFIVFAWIFAEPLTHVIAPMKGDELRPLIVHISRIVLPAQFAFFIGGLMFGTLYARQSFAAPGLGPNLYNLGIIFGALVLSNFVQPGIVGMGWGALVGAIVGNLVVPFWVMRKMNSRFRVSFDLQHPGVRKVFKLMAPVVFGLSLPGVYAMITRALGTGFDDGINTALEIGNKLMQAPLGVFGQSLAIAAFPALAQFFAQNRMDLYRDQLVKTSRTVLYLAAPVSALMFALSDEIVTAVFEYGKFGSADSFVVAQCLRMYCIGIAAWCLHPVLMRAFFAVHKTLPPVLLGTGATGVFFALAYAMMATPLGYLALPLAGSLTAILLVVAMLIQAYRTVGGFDIPSLLKALGQVCFASAVAGAVVYAAASLTPTGTGVGRNLWAMGKVVVLGLSGAWIYGGITYWMKMPETQYLDRALSKFPGRRGS